MHWYKLNQHFSNFMCLKFSSGFTFTKNTQSKIFDGHECTGIKTVEKSISKKDIKIIAKSIKGQLYLRKLKP